MLTVLLVLTAVALGRRSGRPGRRLRSTRPSGEHPARRPPERRPLVEQPGRRLSVCCTGGALLGWAVAGSWGVVGGVAAGVAASWWSGGLEPPSVTREREAVVRDLPLAVDLLAACAEVGLPPERALEVVAPAVGGPLGDRLAATRARLRLGVDPATEWRSLGSDRLLAPLGRAMLRSIESGAPLASGLARLAGDQRRERRVHGQVKARRVGVLAAGPLGLCFLPAFMLIGVVPTVVSTFSSLVL